MTVDDVISDEDRQVEHLRRRLKGQMNDDMYNDYNYFVRFLRARNHNLHAAEDMIRNNLNWRRLNKVDTILSDFTLFEVCVKYLAANHLGFDLDGGPITYSEFGNIDAKGLAKSAKVSDITKHCIHHLERESLRLKQQSEKMGRLIDKWVYVINFENFTLASATDRATLDFLKNLVKMYDANYPERLRAGIIINASFYFTLLFAIVKPFLSPATQQKIKIFGKDGWQNELKNYIGPDTLPVFLGGERTDPDGNPMCNTIICHGGTVPQRYFIRRDRKSFSKLPDVKRIVVSRRSKADIEFFVEESGSTVEWDFDIKSRDVGFTVLYKDEAQESDCDMQVLPLQRVDTSLCSETGMMRCDKPGKYILQFDNTFSWMHSKEIYYSISVTKPDQCY